MKLIKLLMSLVCVLAIAGCDESGESSTQEEKSGYESEYIHGGYDEIAVLPMNDYIIYVPSKRENIIDTNKTEAFSIETSKGLVHILFLQKASEDDHVEKVRFALTKTTAKDVKNYLEFNGKLKYSSSPTQKLVYGYNTFFDKGIMSDEDGKLCNYASHKLILNYDNEDGHCYSDVLVLSEKVSADDLEKIGEEILQTIELNRDYH